MPLETNFLIRQLQQSRVNEVQQKFFLVTEVRLTDSIAL